MKTFEQKWADAGEFFATVAAKQTPAPAIPEPGDSVRVTVRTTLDDIVVVDVHSDGTLHADGGETLVTLSEIETSVGLAYTVTCSAWVEAIVVPAAAWDRLRISASLHRIRRAEHAYAYYRTQKNFDAVDECISAMLDNDIVNHRGIFAPWRGAGDVSVAYRVPLSREEFHRLDDIIALAHALKFDGSN